MLAKGILHFPDGGYPLGAKGVNMALALVEHNTRPIRPLRLCWRGTARAAVVHPTRTVKRYTAFKLIKDYHDTAFIWLSPVSISSRTKDPAREFAEVGTGLFPWERPFCHLCYVPVLHRRTVGGNRRHSSCLHYYGRISPGGRRACGRCWNSAWMPNF